MNKGHENLLTARLEQVCNAGAAHVLWNELYLWYGVQKIAARTLRDLSDRWHELTDGEHGALMKIDGAGGWFLVAENTVAAVYAEKSSD